MFENLVFRRFSTEMYGQNSNISRTLVGHKIVDHSYAVGASPVEGKMFVGKTPSREIRVQTLPITLKFERHISSKASKIPAKFQSDTIIMTCNLATSKLLEIFR